MQAAPVIEADIVEEPALPEVNGGLINAVPELLLHGPLHPFHPAIERGRAGRENEQANAFLLTGGLEHRSGSHSVLITAW